MVSRLATEKKLVPASATQFPGSFASEFRREHREHCEARSWRSIVLYFTYGWEDISIWKSAFIEFVGTTCLCYISALIHTTIVSSKTSQVAAYVGITNIFLISLFIYALAPASGGHVNPLITFTTMVTGLTSFSRGVLYLIAQTVGGGLAGGLIRGSFGRDLSNLYQGGGCLFDPSLISPGQAYLIESMLSFALIFLSFGVGLDPRQAQVFGPRVGPFLTACSLALVSFCSIGLGEGYPGAGLNPTRCFSFAVARGNFQYQWIWWIGPLSGGLMQALVYHIAPPYHREMHVELETPTR